MKKRFAYGALVFAILVASFAVGFTLVPSTAEACVPHPACPGFGCAATASHCGCSVSGGPSDRWETYSYCVNAPWIKFDATCYGYICAP